MMDESDTDSNAGEKRNQPALSMGNLSYKEYSSVDEDYPSQEEILTTLRRRQLYKSSLSSSIFSKSYHYTHHWVKAPRQKMTLQQLEVKATSEGQSPQSQRISRCVAHYYKARNIPGLAQKESEISNGQDEDSQRDEDIAMQDASHTNIETQSRNDSYRQNYSADIALPSIEDVGIGHIRTPFRRRRGPMSRENDYYDNGSPMKRQRMVLREQSSSDWLNNI